MLAEQPACRTVSFAGVGHAPALMEPSQTKAIEDWLMTGARSASDSESSTGHHQVPR